MGCSSSTAVNDSTKPINTNSQQRAGPTTSGLSAENTTGGNPSDTLRRALPPDRTQGEVEVNLPDRRADNDNTLTATRNGFSLGDTNTAPQPDAAGPSDSYDASAGQQADHSNASRAPEPDASASGIPPTTSDITESSLQQQNEEEGRKHRLKSAKRGRAERAKTAERRARTANRMRERRDECRTERQDHFQRVGLERFRDAVRKLQSNKDLMQRLRRESQMAQEAELDALCFSLDDMEPETEPEGPIPSMEEYLEKLRNTKPVVS